MAVLDDISATVEVGVWVNGRKVEIEDLAVNTQRLMNACQAVLPPHYLDDTREQKEIRRSLSFLHDMKCFDA